MKARILLISLLFISVGAMAQVADDDPRVRAGQRDSDAGGHGAGVARPYWRDHHCQRRQAVLKYGSQAENGVVYIETASPLPRKEMNVLLSSESPHTDSLLRKYGNDSSFYFIVNGKPVTPTNETGLMTLDRKTFRSVRVISEKEVQDKYQVMDRKRRDRYHQLRRLNIFPSLHLNLQHMKLDILAIAVHPDDVELGCAGTLMVHARRGMKVGVVDLTRGELGTRGTPELREQEAQVAAKIMGLEIRENLGLADGFFRNDTMEQMAIITAIRKYRPLSIVLANAMDDRHPDHGKGRQTDCRQLFPGRVKKDSNYGRRAGTGSVASEAGFSFPAVTVIMSLTL